jgi:nucleoside 2-deoxyribosyltransferase
MSGRSVFVAVPHAPEFAHVVDELLVPALESVGARVIRVRNTGAGNATGQILSGIREADAIIAIATGRNANVFWELGVAYALAKPVILLAENAIEFGLASEVATCILIDAAPDVLQDRVVAALSAAFRM